MWYRGQNVLFTIFELLLNKIAVPKTETKAIKVIKIGKLILVEEGGDNQIKSTFWKEKKAYPNPNTSSAA